jgi:hypothetical protein
MAKESGKAEKGAARSRRLAAALRENLKRRKAQARGRAAAAAAAAVPQGERALSDVHLSGMTSDFRRNRSSD